MEIDEPEMKIIHCSDPEENPVRIRRGSPGVDAAEDKCCQKCQGDEGCRKDEGTASFPEGFFPSFCRPIRHK